VFGVSTYLGLLTFGPGLDTTPLGVDAAMGSDSMLPPVPGRDRAVSVHVIASTRRSDGMMTFQMNQYALPGATALASRPILLGARPQTLVLMDGRIAITAGGSTVVLSAPEAEVPAR
jgi:hypothetical protein